MDEYYILPDIEELASGAAGERAAVLRARIALAIGNREALMRVLGDGAEFDNFYPDMSPPQLSTNATIDAFLDRFGSQGETDLITRMIFDGSAARGALEPEPVAEGAQDEVPREPSGSDLTARRIDAYLAANPVPEAAPQIEPAPAQETEPEPEPSAPALSETFASMMIKNGNYTKALEIILQLSLDMPKKSIYFADQIRFLRKLIANKERLESAE